MIRQIIVLLAVFAIVIAGATAVIWTQIIPEYRATAEVRVRPVIPHLVFQTEDNGVIRQYEAFKNTQASIIKSLAVLQRVLEQQEIQETRWYKEPRVPLIQRLQNKTPASQMERLRKALVTQARDQSEIIDVSFMTSNSKDAGIILDAVLEQYMQHIGERSDTEKDTLYRKLIEQYKELENEIKGRETIISQLHRSLGAGSPEELITSMRLRIEDTRARLSELQRDIKILEWESSQAVTEDRNDLPIEPTERTEKKPQYHEDTEWRMLDRNVRTIQHSIASRNLDPNNPENIRATKDLEFAKELLQLREAQLDERRIEEQKNNKSEVTSITTIPGDKEDVTSTEFQLNRAKQREKLLAEEFEKQQAEFDKLFKDAQILENENKELEHKRELLKAVRQRLDQKNIESSVSGAIEVLTPAFSPSEPYKDHRILFTAIVLAAGIFGLAVTSVILHKNGFL